MTSDQVPTPTWKDVASAVAEGRVAHVFELCQAVLAQRPSHGPTLLALGESLTGMARYGEAQAALEEVLAQAPEKYRHRVLRALGDVYDRQGELTKAEHYYREALATRRDDATDYIYLGSCLARQGRLQEAEECHRKATLCAEGCVDEAYLNLGLVLRAQNRYVEAKRCFDRAIELDAEYTVAIEALDDVVRAMELDSSSA